MRGVRGREGQGDGGAGAGRPRAGSMAALVGEVAEVEAGRGVHRVGYLVQRNIFFSRAKVQGGRWTPASEPGPGAPEGPSPSPAES